VQDYYVGVFQKVYNSQEWQSYLTKKGLLPGWLTGDKLTAYFVKEKEAHRKLLVSMGEIK
jgi:tripartite-type tricarboxylate transporter receptor subunit TctC